jgi:hypothetical protein
MYSSSLMQKKACWRPKRKRIIGNNHNQTLKTRVAEAKNQGKLDQSLRNGRPHKKISHKASASCKNCPCITKIR